MAKTQYTPHPTAIAVAKRVSQREARPSDQALELVDNRIAALEKLKTVIVTNEYNAIANAIFAVDRSTAQHPSLDAEYSRVAFHVYMSGLKRWEDPKMIDFINSMTAIRPDAMDMSENKDYFSRDYKFTWKFRGGLSIEVNLNAYEDKETSECRRVQIGTKTVEQPVYRYDCVVPAGEVNDKLPAPVLALDL